MKNALTKRVLNACALVSVFMMTSLSMLQAQPLLEFKRVDKNYIKPVDIKYSGDDPDKIFVVQQTGQIFIVDMNTKKRSLFLDISPKIKLSGQKGLLGVAFHPDYKKQRQVFYLLQ